MKGLFVITVFGLGIGLALLVAMSPEMQAIGAKVLAWLVELAKSSMV